MELFKRAKLNSRPWARGLGGVAVRSRWDEYRMCEVQVIGNQIPAAESCV